MEPFNAHSSRRKWQSAVPVQVIILLLTLVLAVFSLALLRVRVRPSESPGLWLIVCGLLGVLLLLDVRAIYQQVHNNRLRHEWGDELMLFRLIRENAADMIAVV